KHTALAPFIYLFMAITTAIYFWQFLNTHAVLFWWLSQPSSGPCRGTHLFGCITRHTGAPRLYRTRLRQQHDRRGHLRWRLAHHRSLADCTSRPYYYRGPTRRAISASPVLP